MQRLSRLSTPKSNLWVKRDDLTNEVYGGNKVRKLDLLLDAARSKGARRLLTMGTAGSHQALATVAHGRPAGFEVAAILAPQPWSAYAVDNLRAALALGLDAIPARSLATVPFVFAKALRRHDFVIDPGGSNIVGTRGYVDAMSELDLQVQAGELPKPDAIVVALGTGGTAAGLLAGVVALGYTTKIIAVRIVGPALMGREKALWLAFRAVRRRGLHLGFGALLGAFELEPGYLGRGYGHETEKGTLATGAAASEGLALDATYTAKAFAAALDLARTGRFANILYWHTLPGGSRPDPMPALPDELDRLFTGSRAIIAYR